MDSDHGGCVCVCVYKARVRCKRCSGWTDYVQGSGACAERGAKGVESRHVCSAGGWVPGVPLWALHAFILVLPLSGHSGAPR